MKNGVVIDAACYSTTLIVTDSYRGSSRSGTALGLFVK